MNPQEALKVLRKVVAYQPNQRIDDLTPEAWAEALEPHDLGDALAVVKELALAPRSEYRPPFIEIGDIVNELRAIERRRSEERWPLVQQLMPNFPLVQDERGYARTNPAELEWLRRMSAETRKPDWTPPETPAIEPARPVQSLVKQVAAIRNANRAVTGPPPLDTHCPGCNCEQP